MCRFKKDTVMDVIDERGSSGWIKVKLDGKEGLVPRNYVFGLDPEGDIEIAIKKGKKKSKDRKTMRRPVGTARPKSSKHVKKDREEANKEDNKDASTEDKVASEKPKMVPEEDYRELEQKYQIYVVDCFSD